LNINFIAGFIQRITTQEGEHKIEKVTEQTERQRNRENGAKNIDEKWSW
jgi:hypothetical protein